MPDKYNPMLAATAEALDGQAPIGLTYPVMVSPKFDGVRAIRVNSVLVSRTLKTIQSPRAQLIAAHLPDGIDGELIVGEPNQDPYLRTVSAVMSRDDNTQDLRFHIFDNFLAPGGFYQRHSSLPDPTDFVRIIPHYIVRTPEELIEKEIEFLEQGYEGLMIRSMDGPYKHGRSTLKQGYMIKLKRFKDAEGVVTGTYEQMHNANEATTNALGHTERSTRKEGMEPTGMLGGFFVKVLNGPHTGADFKVSSSTIAVVERTPLWQQRKSLEGRVLTFKYFPTGSKAKPRIPVFKGWRAAIDTPAKGKRRG